MAQELSRRIKRGKSCLKVPFPKGTIRRIKYLKGRWPYLSESDQRTVACTIQLCDVNRWQLNVWDISLTAGSMWEWHSTLPVVAVIETLEVLFVRKMGWSGDRCSFKDANDALRD